jgi:transcription elongation factor Elf1
LLWLPLAGLLKISAYLQGGRVISKVKIKKPAIVLTNHTSFRDYIFTTAALYPHRITYMAAAKMFNEPERGPFLRMARAIPKASFQSDTRSVISALSILKQKGILSIFPEGQISYHGTSLLPPYSIAKFIKKAGVNVYIAQIQNDYLMAPPWSDKVFKGKVFIKVFDLFKAEELKTLDEAAVYQAINDKLSFNTGAFNREHRHKYQVQDVDNLESLVYQCPKCRHEGLGVNKNTLVCPECGHVLTYDEYGFLNGESVYELFEKQRAEIVAQIDEDSHYSISAPVTLIRYQDQKLAPVGQGVLALDRERYTYTGTDKGQDTVLIFSTKTVEYLPSDIGKNVQIYADNELYMFRMDDKIMPQKFVIVGEYMHKLASRS